MANIIQAMQGMMGLFKPYLSDLSTLDEIYHLSRDGSRWNQAHDLFQRICKDPYVVIAELVSA
jgi:hypothetical protein